MNVTWITNIIERVQIMDEFSASTQSSPFLCKHLFQIITILQKLTQEGMKGKT